MNLYLHCFLLQGYRKAVSCLLTLFPLHTFGHKGCAIGSLSHISEIIAFQAGFCK